MKWGGAASKLSQIPWRDSWSTHKLERPHINGISKNLKSCGIIFWIRNTFNNKSKTLISYSLIHPYLTYCVNVWTTTDRTNLKILCTAQKRLLRALFATAQQPHSRDIFLNQKILPLDKLIIQQKGIYLPNKWSVACTSLATFSLTEMTGIIFNLEAMIQWNDPL